MVQLAAGFVASRHESPERHLTRPSLHHMIAREPVAAPELSQHSNNDGPRRRMRDASMTLLN